MSWVLRDLPQTPGASGVLLETELMMGYPTLGSSTSGSTLPPGFSPPGTGGGAALAS